jgi:sucrose-6-phosphate hydrolase SacC (GH32 family)
LLAGLIVGSDDIVLADFEQATYGPWKTTGNAFGKGPAEGTLPGQMPVTGFDGKKLVNSFLGGDGTTGTLTSPEFSIDRDYIRFLIGGGGWENETLIRLVVDGQAVRSTAGPNTVAGGSEELLPAAWNVRDLLGKSGTIEIIDRATGGWGHINVDQIVLTDTKPRDVVGPRERSILLDLPILALPIKTGGPKRKLTFSIDGQVVLSLDIELADGEPDWWASIPTDRWVGKQVLLHVDRLQESSKGLDQIHLAQSPPSKLPLYAEPIRPQFHFSSQRGWNNDPNGLSYYRGEYHLFYQHNPVGWNWGNMHWGHAVSKDLVHWQELSDKLWPDREGAMFSGSGVVDRLNTSGFGTKDSPAHILLYTAWGNPTGPDVQSLAYSLDARTYRKFADNPVVKQITPGNRDPKVIWHEPTHRWVMALYVEQPKGTHTVQFLTSSDLKSWSLASSIAGFYECPDIFPLLLDDRSDAVKWILTAADSDYVVGSFDGSTFVPESKKLKGHRGRGFYAAQTFSDVPISDGRRIQIGWLQAPSPGMPFNQAMSLPLELRLISTTDGARLTWAPAKELASIRRETRPLTPRDVPPSKANLPLATDVELYELEVVIQAKGANRWSLDLRGAELSIDLIKNELILLDHHVPLGSNSTNRSLRIFGDRTSIEVFVDDGQIYVPMPFIADPAARTISIKAEGGPVALTDGHLHHLRSIWPTPSP